MSSADLDYIRALLVAQTAETEPPATGLFGRLFAPRAAQRRHAGPPPHQPFALMLDLDEPDAPGAARRGPDAEPERLLEPSPSSALQIEAASPLPAPAPRAGFGRRPDLRPEPELVLDQPASHVRRLQLLDPNGQPVGEMVLQPDRSSIAAPPAEVPFFPEDFLDHQGCVSAAEPEPLRPWLKALRKSSLPPKPAIGVPDAETAETIPLAKRVRQRRTQTRRSTPKAAPQPLGHDLLDALALTLAREHETLADRLLTVAQDEVFIRAFAEPAAA